MAKPSDHQVTQLLQDWSNGDRAALDALTPLVYRELHRLARRYMGRERADHTLQATALINEVYVRMIDTKGLRWQNRAHFFAIAARLMRQILVDFARARTNLKRGGVLRQLSLDDALVVSRSEGADVVALDDALRGLSKLDPRKGKVVELRFFGGLSVAETAEVLQVSPGTVERDWRLARMWLLRELSRPAAGHR